MPVNRYPKNYLHVRIFLLLTSTTITTQQVFCEYGFVNMEYGAMKVLSSLFEDLLPQIPSSFFAAP